MLRGEFLRLVAAATAMPYPLHVNEGGRDYHLTATFYTPDGPGPFPLVVLNHGAPANYDEVASQFTRFALQSRWFAARGWAVIVPNRRGYGGSSGPFAEATGVCSHPDFYRATNASANDVIATIDVMRAVPQVDANRIVIAGVSAGGFASLAAGARAPRGLVGIINIDGGRGSLRAGQLCDPDQLVAVARRFGATTAVPSLWLYAKNDFRFPPSFARRMYDAYVRAQDPPQRNTFTILPPYGDDGHLLFEARDAMSLWTPRVRPFLDRLQ